MASLAISNWKNFLRLLPESACSSSPRVYFLSLRILFRFHFVWRWIAIVGATFSCLWVQKRSLASKLSWYILCFVVSMNCESIPIYGWFSSTYEVVNQKTKYHSFQPNICAASSSLILLSDVQLDCLFYLDHFQTFHQWFHLKNHVLYDTIFQPPLPNHFPHNHLNPFISFQPLHSFLYFPVV